MSAGLTGETEAQREGATYPRTHSKARMTFRAYLSASEKCRSSVREKNHLLPKTAVLISLGSRPPKVTNPSWFHRIQEGPSVYGLTRDQQATVLPGCSGSQPELRRSRVEPEPNKRQRHSPRNFSGLLGWESSIYLQLGAGGGFC